MEIIKCDQGSDEWFEARVGSIGGSTISSVVAGGQGKMRKNLMYRLIGEILSGVKYEGYSNQDMERGILEEPDARNLYEMMRDVEVEKIGLVKATDHKHFSPDGFIGTDGIVEIKSAIPSIHVERILTDKIEGNYIKQMTWGLHVCERKWVDFVSYSPLIADRPLWVKRYEWDEKLIKQLNEGADKFIGEMILLIKKIKGG